MTYSLCLSCFTTEILSQTVRWEDQRDDLWAGERSWRMTSGKISEWKNCETEEKIPCSLEEIHSEESHMTVERRHKTREESAKRISEIPEILKINMRRKKGSYSINLEEKTTSSVNSMKAIRWNNCEKERINLLWEIKFHNNAMAESICLTNVLTYYLLQLFTAVLYLVNAIVLDWNALIEKKNIYIFHQLNVKNAVEQNNHSDYIQ